jgi:hypothetical protein
MNNGLRNFERDFLSYVCSLSLEEDKTYSFGDMSFDYDLIFSGGRYQLKIYDVALDHYGMPYRNVLSFEEIIVDYLFEV